MDSKAELIAEHRHLVKVLLRANKAECKLEAEKQKAELDEYLEEKAAKARK